MMLKRQLKPQHADTSLHFNSMTTHPKHVPLVSQPISTEACNTTAYTYNCISINISNVVLAFIAVRVKEAV